MLYVTSRNNSDTYTAHRAASENRAPDGGLYLPFRVQPLSSAAMEQLMGQSFNACVAAVLNGFFQTKLSGWDLDFGTGRFPVRMESMSHRMVIAESWHNSDWEFSGYVENVAALLGVNRDAGETCGHWVETASRIAVLFGLFAEMHRAGMIGQKDKVDISLVSGDFSAPLSAWIAREMGLPIGNIVLCCNENCGIWNLIYHGELRTDTVCVPTSTVEADVCVPEHLEALISFCAGPQEVDRYLEVCRRGRLYCTEDALLKKLNSGIEVSVISEARMKQTIPSVYATNTLLLSPYGALAYAGLLDYRARTGENRLGLVLTEKSPAKDLNTVSDAMKIPLNELETIIRKG